MQFQVPQFETENKLIGPFTIVQFTYISFSAIISFLLFPILTTWFWLAISAILIGSALAIALIKINGRPMTIFIISAFNYLWEPKTLSIKPKAEVIGLKKIEPLPKVKKFEVPPTEEEKIPAKIAPQKKSRLQDLFNKITTTSSPIPFREESLKQNASAKTKKEYELVRKPSGEVATARRVDYR
ncbi:MAG: hypothetical protein PHS16_00180 [Candidatus Colwellbacteria bacterium]|jgi:hypothetical protein|nr:hypothetical protein [Candidatus Colwellbacteria bacterium]MCK9497216.1 hypothetical protein [Candidatus Colwellbacteria bacterium]MDD3752357.1 hypothetical protein [Candidatus Colwellbacteria bacterium]MDD4818577.1 hypothetical protein [Candidatus Colwellbacteria bacterium]